VGTRGDGGHDFGHVGPRRRLASLHRVSREKAGELQSCHLRALLRAP